MNSALIAYYIVGVAVVCTAAADVFVLALRRGWQVPRGLLIGAIAVVPMMLLVMSMLKFASLHMYADVAHWLQLIRSIADTGFPHVLTHEFFAPGTRNYLSVHFVPLVYLFALPFKMLPYPQTLLILNVLTMCSAAIPLYLLARHRTSDRRFMLLCAALLLWYPTFQYATLYEFEMLRFSIPIMLWMLYAWERQRMGWCVVFAVLACLVREDVGLTVAMFGLYGALVARRRVVGAVLTAVGFGAFALITQVVMPALRGTGADAHIAQGFFSAFGATPIEVIGGILRNPFRALAFAADAAKIANLGMLFLPLLFLPLLAPAALIPALATFAIGLVSSSTSYTHTSYLLYYVAPAVPFLFWAFVRAWPTVMAWVERRTMARYGTESGRRAASAAMGGVLAGVFVAQIFFGPSPLALQFWSDRFRPAPFKTQSFHWSTYRVTPRHRAVESVIAYIPRDAIVSTQQFLMPRLVHVRGTMEYPQLVSRDGQHRAEYVLLDGTNNGLRAESPAAVTSEEFDLVRSHPTSWESVAQQDAYVLYRIRP